MKHNQSHWLIAIQYGCASANTTCLSVFHADAVH